MLRYMLKSKIHRCRITEVNLDYEGSLSVDKSLLEEANILPYERIDVYNISNGCRFATYALEAGKGSGIVCVNGAASRLCYPGDIIIIAAYALISEEEISCFKPKIVFVDSANKVIKHSG